MTPQEISFKVDMKNYWYLKLPINYLNDVVQRSCSEGQEGSTKIRKGEAKGWSLTLGMRQ